MTSIRTAALVSALMTLAPWALRAQPVRSGWIMSASRAENPEQRLARSLPEVHSVEDEGDAVIVRSAGISVHSLAPFQSPPTPVERLRSFEFRVPSQPRPAADQPVSVRPDMLGVFLNGQPIYNYFDAASYQGQNIWRYDPIARNDDGTVTAGGSPRDDLDQKPQLALLRGLIANSARQHSPILGYAFDGSPVYGPWGFANADGSGVLRRLRSSFQLRAIATRTRWPDGTELTAAQTGPPVSPAYPLGSFVEDYELVPGSGDLDRFNGRFAVTPDYPGGVYAYFLSTDDQGRLAFPYFIGGHYRGAIAPEELDRAALDRAVDEALSETPLFDREGDGPLLRLRFRAGPEIIEAGQPALLSFRPLGKSGHAIRSLEYVHERPIHLLVVSEDLSQFDHIHPELRAGDRYLVRHTFPSAGVYRLYADYTPPGETQRVESFTVRVAGAPRAIEPLQESKTLSKVMGPIQVELSTATELTTAKDLELVFRVRDAATGKRIPDLRPYLGAWGHFALIREGHGSFIHAHPIEESASGGTDAIGHSHIHGAGSQALGPPPQRIRVTMNFERAGLYKLWAQFRVEDRVVTTPFTLAVGEAPAPEQAPIPEGATVIRITSSGFEPSRVTIKPGQPATLAFVRSVEPICGREVVFPALGITRHAPLGGVAIVEVPASPAGELAFACGMGMYRGAVVIGVAEAVPTAFAP